MRMIIDRDRSGIRSEVSGSDSLSSSENESDTGSLLIIAALSRRTCSSLVPS